MDDHAVYTAGVKHEDRKLDVTSASAVHALVEAIKPHHIVCTAGVNVEGTIEGSKWFTGMVDQMTVNYYGPMLLVSEFTRYWRDNPEGVIGTHHCVAISSNSATIARSKSGSYCASKAALSMGYRCAAREQAEGPFAIYTYEPGWLMGTPMSQEVRDRVGKVDPSAALHRIPGGNMVNVEEFAHMIVKNLSYGRWLNGCTLRVDGGDQ